MELPVNDLHIAKWAQNDLNEIKQYITGELNNPFAAIATLKKITVSIRILRDYTLADAILTSITDVQSNYRFLKGENYIVLYHVHGKDVFVDRILYGHRDYLRVLFGEIADDE